jgi:hypothetical protein
MIIYTFSLLFCNNKIERFIYSNIRLYSVMAHKRPWERNLEIDPPWVMNSQETTIQDFERMHSNGHATGVDLDYIRSQIDDLLKSSSARNSLTSAEIPSNHGDSVAEFYAAQNNGSVWGILEDHLDDVIDRFEVPIQAVSRALSYVGNATGMVSNTLEDSLAYAINKLEVPAHIMKEYVSAAGSAIAEAYSAVPAPARAGALTSLFAFLIACGGGNATPTVIPTIPPENTKPVAEATVRPAEKPAATEEPREEPAVESKPTYEPPEPEPTVKPESTKPPYKPPTPTPPEPTQVPLKSTATATSVPPNPTEEPTVKPEPTEPPYKPPTPTPPKPSPTAKPATATPQPATAIPVNTSTAVPSTPEPTFRDYALERLQRYNSKDPVEVYNPESLERMLEFVELNESLISDFDGRDFHILTTFLTDNPDAVEHATAVDQYVREIDDMIFDYVGIQDLDHKIEGYGDTIFEEEEQVSIRDMINLNWSNFLPFVDNMDAEQRLLPREIFITDLTETGRKYSDEIDSDRYNERIDSHRPNLVEVASYNITSFQEIRENALRVAKHPDYIAEAYNDGKKTTESALVINLGKRVWTNSAEQAEHDITALLNEGSEKANVALKVYAYNQTIWGNKSGFPESRVELAIGDLWTLPEYGIKPYRISASGHGELAFGITGSDLELMMSISDERFLVLPSPYGGMSTNIQWTRTERVKKDGIDQIRYVADDGHREVLISLK